MIFNIGLPALLIFILSVVLLAEILFCVIMLLLTLFNVELILKKNIKYVALPLQAIGQSCLGLGFLYQSIDNPVHSINWTDALIGIMIIAASALVIIISYEDIVNNKKAEKAEKAEKAFDNTKASFLLVTTNYKNIVDNNKEENAFDNNKKLETTENATSIFEKIVLSKTFGIILCIMLIAIPATAFLSKQHSAIKDKQFHLSCKFGESSSEYLLCKIK